MGRDAVSDFFIGLLYVLFKKEINASSWVRSFGSFLMVVVLKDVEASGDPVRFCKTASCSFFACEIISAMALFAFSKLSLRSLAMCLGSGGSSFISISENKKINKC